MRAMIFAENANGVGTDQVAIQRKLLKTPFFIAACDTSHREMSYAAIVT